MVRRKHNVAVIYNKDAKSWCDYIKREVNRVDQPEDKINFSYIQDTDMFPTMNEETQSSLCSAKVIVVIASPMFLHCINKDESRHCIIQDPENAILFLCGVTVQLLELSGISKRFHNFEKWTKITHINARDLLLRIVVNVENAAGNPTPLCALKAKQDAAAVKCGGVPSKALPTTNCVDPKWAFDITPKCVRSEEQTEIVMFFHNPVAEDCQLKIILDEVKLSVCRRNASTFCFTAPEHREGDVKFEVEYDNEEIGELTLRYKCEMEKINGLIQIHLQALELICQHTEIKNDDLDRMLSKLFDEKSSTIPVEAFENLFGMHEYATNTNLQHELPTLLHFAAKYGLKEFTCKLIDLPGALLTYSIGNKDGQRPAEIAHKFNYRELAEYFDAYIEMNGMLYEMIEPYMSFNIDSPCYMEMQAYYNSSNAPIPQDIYSDASPITECARDQLYMDMSRGGKVQSVYMRMDKPKLMLEIGTTKSQKDLYDIFTLLHEKKISAFESLVHINGWVNKHAGGKTFRDKQKRLSELNEQLKTCNRSLGNTDSYYDHPNKSDFVQYMLRQLKRQLADPAMNYVYTVKSSSEGVDSGEWKQEKYTEAHTQHSSFVRGIYEPNPTSPKIASKPANDKPTFVPKPLSRNSRLNKTPGTDVQTCRKRGNFYKDCRKSQQMEALLKDDAIGVPPPTPKLLPRQPGTPVTNRRLPPPRTEPPALLPRQK